MHIEISSWEIVCLKKGVTEKKEGEKKKKKKKRKRFHDAVGFRVF